MHPREQFEARAFGSLRRYLWPILGQTALDARRAIDRAIDQLGVAPAVRTCLDWFTQQYG